jgi:hypothetical protein
MVCISDASTIRMLETQIIANLTETREQERKRSFVISGPVTVFGEKNTPFTNTQIFTYNLRTEWLK